MSSAKVFNISGEFQKPFIVLFLNYRKFVFQTSTLIDVELDAPFPFSRAFFPPFYTCRIPAARHAIRLEGTFRRSNEKERCAAAGYCQCAFIIVDMTTKLVSVAHDICTKTVSVI